MASATCAAAVSGTAIYLARIATPPGAVFEALLTGETSGTRMILARQRQVSVANPPFEIVLPYEGTATALEVHGWIRLPDGRLFFTGATAYEGDPVEVVMDRAKDVQVKGLVGPQWRLFRLGEETVAPMEGERDLPYLVFGGGGVLSGTAGCNLLSTDYAIEGAGGLAIGLAAATMMACPEPVMAREGAMLDLLAAVESFAIDGDRLTLIGGGVPLAVFVAEPLRYVE